MHSYVPTKSRDSALSIGRMSTAGALRTHRWQAEVLVDYKLTRLEIRRRFVTYQLLFLIERYSATFN